MLTSDILKDYLLGMPPGDVFDLSYAHLADVFPPGADDAAARDALRRLAVECDCDVANNVPARRFELTRRRAAALPETLDNPA